MRLCAKINDSSRLYHAIYDIYMRRRTLYARI